MLTMDEIQSTEIIGSMDIKAIAFSVIFLLLCIARYFHNDAYLVLQQNNPLQGLGIVKDFLFHSLCVCFLCILYMLPTK